MPKLSTIADALKQLQSILASLKELLPNLFYQSEQNPKELPMNESKIKEWAKAIGEFESGGNPNSLSMKNNNPGNIKGRDGKFLKFPSYQEGLEYLENYLRRACTGQHSAYKPTMNLKEFCQVYSPDPEPIPTNYSIFIAKRLNVFPSIKIQDLL